MRSGARDFEGLFSDVKSIYVTGSWRINNSGDACTQDELEQHKLNTGPLSHTVAPHCDRCMLTFHSTIIMFFVS